MDYYDLLEYIECQDKYYLQKLIHPINEHKYIKDEIGNIIRKDEVGNIAEEWEDIQQLHGTIQNRQQSTVGPQGNESKVRYYGYFTPEFNIQTNHLNDYRIKMVRPYETLYLKIIKYDPNNFLLGEQHHITLIMQEDKKYQGRQE